MFKLISFFLALLPTLVWALTWQIDHPCRDEISYKGEKIYEDALPSVGTFTVDRLLNLKIPFVGDESGIISISETPFSDAAIEIASDTEMFLYGWCYQVNGVSPDQIPSNYYFNNQHDHLRWYFAYSHFQMGEWVSMCVPAFKRPLSNYCPNR